VDNVQLTNLNYAVSSCPGRGAGWFGQYPRGSVVVGSSMLGQFERGRRLGNDAIAHLLILDDTTLVVTDETIYGLHDAADQLVTRLYRMYNRNVSAFTSHQARLAPHGLARR
jgi:hypothetical protein